MNKLEKSSPVAGCCGEARRIVLAIAPLTTEPGIKSKASLTELGFFRPIARGDFAVIVRLIAFKVHLLAVMPTKCFV